MCDPSSPTGPVVIDGWADSVVDRSGPGNVATGIVDAVGNIPVDTVGMVVSCPVGLTGTGDEVVVDGDEACSVPGDDSASHSRTVDTVGNNDWPAEPSSHCP